MSLKGSFVEFKERISRLEYKSKEITQTATHKEK